MSQIYSKDSLDRFGDDLCEVLLSYMPIKDRFRCECVSKQWQRLIFKSQSHVCLYQRYEGPFKTRLYLNTTQVDIKCIELVLKKLSNMTQIELKDMDIKGNHLLIDLIIKHCHRVNHILLSCDINPLESQNLKNVTKLLATFGKQLRDIDINCLYDCNSFDLLSIKSNEVLFPKLRKLSMKYFGEDVNAFNKLIGIYSKQLKSIDVTIKDKCVDDLRTLMTSLSQISALIDLDLTLFGDNELNAFTIECMKQIGTNCRQLKKMSLFAIIDGNDWQPLIEMINQYFTQLRRFKVRLRMKRNQSSPSLTSKSLNGCKRLTHLSIISLKCNITIDEFMANINQQLPRLEVIELEISGMKVTDDYFGLLSKLPKISKAYMFGANYDNPNETISSIMSKTRKSLKHFNKHRHI